jgi:hypothetical protein
MGDWADAEALHVFANVDDEQPESSLRNIASALRAARRQALDEAERVCRERLSSDSWLERETVACADAIAGLPR